MPYTLSPPCGLGSILEPNITNIQSPFSVSTSANIRDTRDIVSVCLSDEPEKKYKSNVQILRGSKLIRGRGSSMIVNWIINLQSWSGKLFLAIEPEVTDDDDDLAYQRQPEGGGSHGTSF